MCKCNKCKTEIEPKIFKIPRVRDPKQFTEIVICPNCKSQINESEVNKA